MESKLNPAQQSAVLHLDGPFVVFAGAGSGKTRVITQRLAHLIRVHDIPPWEILSMTFTNKAALEMRARATQLAPESSKVLISTFHSCCARWLREFSTELGYESNFTIFDDKDSTTVLKNLLKDAVPKKDLAHLTGEVKKFIQWAKTKALLPNQMEDYSEYISSKFPDIAVETYRKYQSSLEEQNAMDFGDLLMNMLVLLRHNTTVRSIMTKRFRYIMVDEFQDTNQAQMELIKHMASQSNNIFVVGDDDQSIYSWRGALPSNIINFNEHFSNVKTINLQQNYRCTGNIVGAASALIQNNKVRAEKTVFTDNPAGDPIEVIQEKDGEMEAHGIVSSIAAEKDHAPLNEVAIFYRTNSQSRALEEALHRENLPYRIFGSLAFYDRMEIKDLLAYFRYIVNPKDTVSFRRIVNTPPRGIGKKTQSDIEELSEKSNCSLFEATLKYQEKPAVAKFISLIKELEELRESPLESCLSVLESKISYKAYIEKKYPEQFSEKLDNIHELGSAMASASQKRPEIRLASWLEEATLKRDEHTNQSETESISLMTLHMAKGLEFDRVYLAGVEDGLLPHQNSLDDPASLEEERRLLYVGMTRARKKLSIYLSEVRQVYNQYTYHPPSRFLEEIPKKFLGQALMEQNHDEEITYDYSVEPKSDLSLGSTVTHPTFGKGTVRGIDDNIRKKKVIVDFFEFGLKKVLPAHLTVL